MPRPFALFHYPDGHAGHQEHIDPAQVESYRLQADGANVIPAAALPPGLDPKALTGQADKLTAAFHAAVEKTAIDLLQARDVKTDALMKMVGQTQDAAGFQLDYLVDPDNIDGNELRQCRAAVMVAPNSVPTIDEARKITACVQEKSNAELILAGEAAAGVGGFFLAALLLRRQLRQSIERGETPAAAAPPSSPPEADLPIAVDTTQDIIVNKPLHLKAQHI